MKPIGTERSGSEAKARIVVVATSLLFCAVSVGGTLSLFGIVASHRGLGWEYVALFGGWNSAPYILAAIFALCLRRSFAGSGVMMLGITTIAILGLPCLHGVLSPLMT